MMIDLRNALMAGKRLPYDAEVEYLESVGDQYIDTGYKFQFGDIITATFAPTGTPTKAVYFFGADITFNVGLNSHYDPSYGANGVRAVYGGSVNDAFMVTPPPTFALGKVYECRFSPQERRINSSVSTAEVTDTGLGAYSVILFAARRNATIRLVSTGFAVTEKFFNFSVERNGVKILDLNPVRFTNEQGVSEGAMYDRMTGQLFGNAGTGDFVLGPDIPSPV